MLYFKEMLNEVFCFCYWKLTILVLLLVYSHDQMALCTTYYTGNLSPQYTSHHQYTLLDKLALFTTNHITPTGPFHNIPHETVYILSFPTGPLHKIPQETVHNTWCELTYTKEEIHKP